VNLPRTEVDFIKSIVTAFARIDGDTLQITDVELDIKREFKISATQTTWLPNYLDLMFRKSNDPILLQMLLNQRVLFNIISKK